MGGLPISTSYTPARRSMSSPNRAAVSWESAMQPTQASSASEYVVARSSPDRPIREPKRVAIRQDRARCSTGWPSPRSAARESMPTSSATDIVTGRGSMAGV